MISLRISRCIKEIVQALVSRKFDEVYLEDYFKILTEFEIMNAVDSFPGNLTMPKDELDFCDYDFYFVDIEMDIIQIEFMLQFDLEKSDVTLIFFYHDDVGEAYGYSIKDIYIQ